MTREREGSRRRESVRGLVWLKDRHIGLKALWCTVKLWVGRRLYWKRAIDRLGIKEMATETMVGV